MKNEKKLSQTLINLGYQETFAGQWVKQFSNSITLNIYIKNNRALYNCVSTKIDITMQQDINDLQKAFNTIKEHMRLLEE